MSAFVPSAASAATTALGTLHLPDGLVGFSEVRDCTLQPLGALDSPFSILASRDDAELRFVLVEPAPFFPDYAPVLSSTDLARVGLLAQSDALLLAVVTLGARLEDATANLLGPLVVNVGTRVAVQVVLSGQEHPIRSPLVGSGRTEQA